MSVAGGGLDYSVAEEASITMSVAGEASITMSVAERGFDHHVCGRGRPRSPCLRQGEAAITLSVAGGGRDYFVCGKRKSRIHLSVAGGFGLDYHVCSRSSSALPCLSQEEASITKSEEALSSLAQ